MVATFTDLEIENLIIELVGRIIDETDFKLTLSSIEDDGLEIKLVNDKWAINREIDPLSAILYFDQPIPNNNADDNIAVSTLMKTLGKSAGWIRSLQDGIRGQYNSSTSISGYIIGARIRNAVDI